MIASLRGHLQHVGEGEVILEVGGIGFRVAVPSSVLASGISVGQPVFLHTRLIVREDAVGLYGFATPDQVELFDLLLQVSGIGPRLALSILSHLSPEVVRSAVAGAQPEVLTKVPGIGRKTAEKIIFHLKDKMIGPQVPLPRISETDTDLLGVLTGLGYSLVEAQTALQSLPADGPSDTEDRLRLALQYFAKR